MNDVLNPKVEPERREKDKFTPRPGISYRGGFVLVTEDYSDPRVLLIRRPDTRYCLPVAEYKSDKDENLLDTAKRAMKDFTGYTVDMGMASVQGVHTVRLLSGKEERKYYLVSSMDVQEVTSTSSGAVFFRLSELLSEKNKGAGGVIDLLDLEIISRLILDNADFFESLQVSMGIIRAFEK